MQSAACCACGSAGHFAAKRNILPSKLGFTEAATAAEQARLYRNSNGSRASSALQRCCCRVQLAALGVAPDISRRSGTSCRASPALQTRAGSNRDAWAPTLTRCNCLRAHPHSAPVALAGRLEQAARRVVIQGSVVRAAWGLHQARHREPEVPVLPEASAAGVARAAWQRSI